MTEQSPLAQLDPTVQLAPYADPVWLTQTKDVCPLMLAVREQTAGDAQLVSEQQVSSHCDAEQFPERQSVGMTQEAPGPAPPRVEGLPRSVAPTQ